MYKFLKNCSRVTVFLITLMFIGCAMEPLEPEEDYVIKVNDHLVQRNEVNIYIYQVIKEFEEIGGEDVWSFEDFSGGKSAEEVAKEAVVDNVARIKLLVDKASELNVNLTEEQLQQVRVDALDYLDTMDQTYVEEEDLQLADLIHVFTEFALAQEVRNHVTDNFYPSEEAIEEKMLENDEYTTLKNYSALDLLTIVKLEHILLSTREKNQSDEYVTLTEEEKGLKYNTAVQVRKQALEGEDFSYLREQYSDETFPEDTDSYGIYEFPKGLIPSEFADSLKDLKEGDISVVIESDMGYHLFKVLGISIPSEEDLSRFKENFNNYEQELKNSVIEELKDAVFNNLYEEWKESANISVHRKTWETISLKQ